MGYYWCVDQCEYATDIMFNSRKDLEEIYPSLVEHALVNFKCEDVNGFTNKDICAKLYPIQKKEPKIRNKVTRLFSKLRAHGLIRKAPHSRKYYVTSKGYRIMAGVLYLKEKEYTGYVISTKAI